MKKLITANRYFLLPYSIFVAVAGVFVLWVDKAQIHIALNNINTPFLDHFFKLITYLGDGLIYLAILLFVLLISYRRTIAYVIAVALSNLLVFLGKQILFPDSYRPSKFFELYENYQLHVVEGVKLHSMHSFPSGHTTTAFTVFFIVALLVRNNSLKFLCFMIALLTGYSRIYLSQHFIEDVLVGSLIGVFSVLTMWYLSDGFRKSWMDKSLIRRD